MVASATQARRRTRTLGTQVRVRPRTLANAGIADSRTVARHTTWPFATISTATHTWRFTAVVVRSTALRIAHYRVALRTLCPTTVVAAARPITCTTLDPINTRELVGAFSRGEPATIACMQSAVVIRNTRMLPCVLSCVLSSVLSCVLSCVRAVVLAFVRACFCACVRPS